MTDNSQAEVAYLPPTVPPSNHGHTVAAWTTMIGIIIGAFVAAAGVALAVPVLFWVGLVVVVVANVLGLVLRNMGFGQPKPGVTPRRAPAAH